VFNVGGPEIFVILLLALVVLGPDQLPKAMRTFGNVMAEIRKVSGGFQAEMRKAMETLDDQEPTTSSGSGTAAPRALATTPEEADVTEVVARNPEPIGDGGADPAPAPAVDEAGSPAVDPADRAAG
jgi:Tat protein translocase TatB subunit